MWPVYSPQKNKLIPFMGKISALVKTGLAEPLLNNIVTIIDINNVQVSSLCFYLKVGLFTSNSENF